MSVHAHDGARRVRGGEGLGGTRERLVVHLGGGESEEGEGESWMSDDEIGAAGKEGVVRAIHVVDLLLSVFHELNDGLVVVSASEFHHQHACR